MFVIMASMCLVHNEMKVKAVSAMLSREASRYDSCNIHFYSNFESAVKTLQMVQQKWWSI